MFVKNNIFKNINILFIEFFYDLVWNTPYRLTYIDRVSTAADCRSDERTAFSWSSPSAAAIPTLNSKGCAVLTIGAFSFPAAWSRPTFGHRSVTNRECPRAVHTVYWHFWSADSWCRVASSWRRPLAGRPFGRAKNRAWAGDCWGFCS